MAPIPACSIRARYCSLVVTKIDTIRLMPGRYLIWAVLWLVAQTASAQQPQTPVTAPQGPASRGYTVFVGGMVIGREDVTVEANGRALTITGKGRLTGSQDVVVQRAEIRYRADGTAEA